MQNSAKIICFFLVVACLCSTTAIALQADDDKPLVFMNTGSYIGFFGGTNFGMTEFTKIAREKGFRVDQGVHPDLVSGDPLEGIDVYLLFDPNFPFTDQDKIALRQWIRAGGILITSSWWHDSNKIGGFMQEFGVDFGVYRQSTRKLFFTEDSPLSSPLKVSSMVTSYGRHILLLDPKKSEPILKYEDDKIAAARTLTSTGKGEIIAYACLATLYDNNVGGDIRTVDNAKLVENLFSYLRLKLGLDSSFDLSLLKLKTKGGSSFAPGDDIKFVAKIRNIGTTSSDEANIVFYLEKTGSAPAESIQITTATVPAIKANKKIKIAKNTFLPNDLEPGSYQVIAVVISDKSSANEDTDNNTAVAKKKIIIL